MTRITWDKVQEAAKQCVRRQLIGGFPSTVYGIPRGGCHAAQAVVIAAQGYGHKLRIVDEPLTDSLIIDDIIDSGATMKRFPGFRRDALFRKSRDNFYIHGPTAGLENGAELVEGFVQFPWETAESGPEDAVTRILQFVGEDPTRDGLLETPRRVLKAWKELTVGYAMDPKEILNKSFEQPHDELVLLKGIEFHSVCEHHLLPFYGTAAVGYIPTKSVVGISKLARLVNCFARRLQIQERLTSQIATAIQDILKPQGVGVVMTAKHGCMSCRGVMQGDSSLVTSVMLGCLREEGYARAEFLSLMKGGS